MADYLVALQCAEPLLRHVEARLAEAGLESSRAAAPHADHATLLLLAPKPHVLEAEAELLGLEKELAPLREGEAPRLMSERGWPVRSFCVAQRHDFAGIDTDGFFTPAERSKLISAILSTLSPGAEIGAALAAAGIQRRPSPHQRSLIHFLEIIGVLKEHGPLHTHGRYNAWRNSLASFGWRSLLGMKSLVDLDAICKYSGERTAFYFAWQSFYIHSLTAPALFGMLIWWMRPKGLSVEDDVNVPMFSLFAVVWAIFFVQIWRRRQGELCFRWTGDEADHTELIRADFEGQWVESPISGEPELFEASWRRAMRLILSTMATLACLTIPVATMFLSLNLQGYIQPEARRVLGIRVYYESLAAHAEPGAIFDPASQLSLLPVALHAVVIALLNKGFRMIAGMLTEFENHKTQRAFDDSLITKRFIFEAFDCYVALFYIAFELADVDRLRLELISLFSTDTARRVLTESVVPLVLQWTTKQREAALATSPNAGVSEGSLNKPEPSGHRRRLHDLQLEEYDDFDDYLEMVIQFGYITLFASAFPGAAFLALICNILEIFSDLFKVSFLCRRPKEISSSNGIGTWYNLLYVIMVTSIFTNAILFAFSSDQMAMLMPKLFVEEQEGWLSALPGRKHHDHGDMVVKQGMGRFVVLALGVIEHVLLLLLLLAEMFLKKAPDWVALTIARRAYEEKKLFRSQRRAAQIVQESKLPKTGLPTKKEAEECTIS